MFGLRVLSDATFVGGPLDGQHLRQMGGSALVLPPGTDALAIHHGWRTRERGGVGQGGTPLWESTYDPRMEPLDVSIYRAHPDEAAHALSSGGQWYVERLEFVRTLNEQERTLAEQRKAEFVKQFSRESGGALSTAHTNAVAQKIASATLARMNNAPAYAAVHLRELRDALVGELAPLYNRVPSFRAGDFATISKQGDETRA